MSDKIMEATLEKLRELSEQRRGRCIYRAELTSGNGVILRAYEPYGTHADMRIDLGREYVVTPCDLLENAIGECFRSSALTGDTTPFDIKTWRLTLA